RERLARVLPGEARRDRVLREQPDRGGRYRAEPGNRAPGQGRGHSEGARGRAARLEKDGLTDRTARRERSNSSERLTGTRKRALTGGPKRASPSGTENRRPPLPTSVRAGSRCTRRSLGHGEPPPPSAYLLSNGKRDRRIRKRRRV